MVGQALHVPDGSLHCPHSVQNRLAVRTDCAWSGLASAEYVKARDPMQLTVPLSGAAQAWPLPAKPTLFCRHTVLRRSQPGGRPTTNQGWAIISVVPKRCPGSCRHVSSLTTGLQVISARQNALRARTAQSPDNSVRAVQARANLLYKVHQQVTALRRHLWPRRNLPAALQCSLHNLQCTQCQLCW